MAIYEYECSKCGKFEVNQKISDKPLKKCPKCSGKVKKLISASTFVLKGSGWYLTDYAKKSTPDKCFNSMLKKTVGETAKEINNTKH